MYKSVSAYPHVHTQVYKGTHTHMYICWRHNAMSWSIILWLFPWHQASHLTWSSLIKLYCRLIGRSVVPSEPMSPCCSFSPAHIVQPPSAVYVGTGDLNSHPPDSQQVLLSIPRPYFVFFWYSVSDTSGWPKTHYITEMALNLWSLTVLLLLPKYRIFKYVPLCLASGLDFQHWYLNRRTRAT